MTDMNQALEQFMMDLQRFAKDEGERAAEGTTTEAPDSTPESTVAQQADRLMGKKMF